MNLPEIAICLLYTSDAADDNSESSYVINGPEDCYLLIEGRWYLVKNPLEPPISDK
mgnify:CR=1 FL=1